MKKNLAILLICLITCGCTTEYNLDISNDSFKENINISIDKSEIKSESPSPDIDPDDPITPFLNSDYPALFSDEKALYNKEQIDYDDHIDVKMNYKYKAEEFADSNSLKMCFENYEFNYKDNYSIHASGTFYCLYSDELNINIKTNNRVISNNADSVNGNVYTWHIDGVNSHDVDIQIEMSKGVSRDTISTYILVGIVIIIIISIVFVINKKRVKENEL